MPPRKKTSVSENLQNQIEFSCKGISTGWGLINHISGHNDFLFPRGAITEVAGLKSSSKTTLILETIAFNQLLNPDFKVLYLDFERAITNQLEYLQQLGVDMESDNFIIISPSTMEEGLSVLHQIVRDEDFDMIVVDSIAAMRPGVESEKGLYGTKQPGVKGKLMAEALRNVTADMPVDGPAIVFINQLYVDISGAVSFGGPQYVSPSTGALAFYAALRLQVTEKTKLKEKRRNPYTLEDIDVPVGSVIRIEATKNKIGAPYRYSQYMISYGRGIDIVPNVINAAMKMGLITGSSFYTYYSAVRGEDRKAHGMAQLMRWLTEEPEDLVWLGSQISPGWEHDLQYYAERIQRKGSIVSEDVYEDVTEEDSEPAPVKPKRTSLKAAKAEKEKVLSGEETDSPEELPAASDTSDETPEAPDEDVSEAEADDDVMDAETAAEDIESLISPKDAEPNESPAKPVQRLSLKEASSKTLKLQ